MAFDILAWAQSKIPGGRVGGSGWYNVRCPFHQDGHPSFGLNLTTGKWKCKAASCGRSSTEIARLVMLVEQVGWREACAKVDRPNPFDVDDYPGTKAAKPARPTVNPFPDNLVAVSGQRFPTYLRERGYCLQDALAFGLHFGDDAAGPFRGYLVFPYWSLDGEYATYSARRMSDEDHGSRFQQAPHGIAARHLYGAWRFRGVAWAERIFVVEGQFDTLRMWTLGLPAGGLSTSSASPAQLNQIVTLSRIYDAPVCVLLDNGPDGRPRREEQERAAAIVAELSAAMVPAYVGELPEGIKDPDRLTGESVGKLLDMCNTRELQFLELE